MHRFVALFVLLIGSHGLKAQEQPLAAAGNAPPPAPPASAEKHYRAAVEHWQDGRYEDAVREASAAIRLDARYAPAYIVRGLARQTGRHDLDGALADYTRAIELDPASDAAFANRGWANLEKGRLAAAIADCSRAIELNPRNDGAWNNRGWARHRQRDLAGAIADYTRALELNPANDLAYTNRGWAYQESKRLPAAIADYDKALAINRDNALAYTNRGVARWAQGRLDEARDDFHRALKIQPANTLARQNLDRLEQQQRRQRVAETGSTATKRTQPAAKKQSAPTRLATTKPAEQPGAGQEPPRRAPTVWLVAVGIGTYQQSYMFGASLDFTVPGMYEFVRLMERRGLCRERPVVLAESAARRQAIIEALTALTDPRRVGPDDMIVFFYSGHGLMAGPAIGICPYDYTDPSTLIADEEITALLRRSPARHKLCLIEACKSSGTMGPGPGVDLEEFNRRRREIAGGLAYLTSTRAGAPSWGENGKGGYFTQYLLEALDQGLADANGDSIVTVGELYTHVRRRVSERTNRQQVPEINASGYDPAMPVMVVPR